MLSKQKTPFILLGIGIGIMLTNMIYILNPNIEYRDYSEKEIIASATELGMVFIKDNIDTSPKKEEDKRIKTPVNESKEKEIEFMIEKGDSLEKVSEQLLNLGIIDDKGEFNRFVKNKNAQTKLRVGTYKLSPNFDYETIIKILTKDLK